MQNLKWKLVSSQYLLRDDWMALRADKCRMPDGTIVEPYYVLEYNDWVNVVALTPEMDVVLVRQFRQAIGRTILELPCGVMEESDSSPLEAMRRELLEETGYTSKDFVEMAILSPNAAANSNMTHFFLARGVKNVAEPRLDSTEQIEVVLMPFREVIDMARRGEFLQATHVATLFLASSRLGEAL